MLTNLDFLDVVQATNGPFAFCRTCATVIATNPHTEGRHYPLSSAQSLLYRHLRAYHDPPPAPQIPDLVAIRPGLAEALQNSQHRMPRPLPHDSLQFDGLKVWDGLECTLCLAPNLTHFFSQDSMRRHLRKAHSVGQFCQERRYRVVPMQTWFPRHSGGFGIWWRIQPRPRPQRAASPPPPRRCPIVPDPHVERSQLGAESKDDLNPYLEQTRWPEIFRQRPYWQALRQATYLPRPARPLQLADEQDASRELLDASFDLHSEAILEVILASQQRLFKRCEATFATTPPFLRHWLSSQYGDKPFRFAFQWLQNQGSLARYLGCWKRLLCLVFRASRLRVGLGAPFESRVLGVATYLTPRQQALVRELWGLASTIHRRQVGSRVFDAEDFESNYLASIGSSLGQELEEGLMELSISLLVQPLDPWSSTSRHLLAYYAGIRSLDLTSSSTSNGGFVPISQSTSTLSCLIWVSRLLFLEFALPQKAYRRPAWPDRESYPNALARLQTVLRAHMVHESSAALSELHRLRALGRRFRTIDIGRTLLFWSQEDAVVTVEKQSLLMIDFRHWIQGVILRGQQQLRSLMQGFTAPKLPSLEALSESISYRVPGVSFLNLPPNRRRLTCCTQAFIQSSRWLYVDEAWSEQRCQRYLGAHDQFLTTLLLLLYLTSGQPARGPEILSIKVCNTEQSLRNIVLHQGRLCLLTSYNKCTANTRQPFYIIRFPPESVGQLLYTYLVLVRPLVRHIEEQLGLASPVQSHYLWPTYPRQDSESGAIPPLIDTESTLSNEGIGPDTETSIDGDESEAESEAGSEKSDEGNDSALVVRKQGCWSTGMLTAALRQSCQTYSLSMIFTVALYRQVAIGITKKHLRPGLQPSQTEPHLATATRKIYAWQAGHSIEQEMQSYGLDGSYPTHLQPLLFDLYHAASEAWHRWLEIGPATSSVSLESRPITSPTGLERRPVASRRSLDSRPTTSPLLEAARQWGKQDRIDIPSTALPRPLDPKRKHTTTLDTSGIEGALTGDQTDREERQTPGLINVEQGANRQRVVAEPEPKRRRIEYEKRWDEGRKLIVLI